MVAEYTWDERDRLVRSIVGDKHASYVYGEDGQRTNKWTVYEETLYFNRMWTWHDGNANNDQTAKHIYLGSERIISQMNSWKRPHTYSEESHKTYYYHSDHLGGAQLVTDYQGEEYQRIEYTPYGEEWVDKFQNENYVDMPYKFTGKERDEETGLYYYGARYLDPQTSVWLSTDPALGEYIPQAGKDNSQLPGLGGVFNSVNLNLYHYAANNPVKYIDPDGRDVFMAGITVTVSCGTGLTVETGLIMGIDKNGNYQIGTYQISGGGFAPSLGASGTGSISWAPFAEHISDVAGLTETMGGSFTFGFIFGLNLGGDINIPIDGPIENFYVSFHIGVGTSGGEGHALTTSTTTQLYGEGQSFKEAWKNAKMQLTMDY